MRLNLKGLNCKSSYKSILKVNPNSLMAFDEMRASCNFADLIEGSDLFDIYKTYHILNEVDLDEFEDYHIKPNVGDEFFYENKAYLVVRVIIYPSNTVTAIISKVVSEVPSGQSFDEVKASALVELKRLGVIHNVPTKDGRENNIVSLFPEIIEDTLTTTISIPNQSWTCEDTREINNNDCECGEGCCDVCGVQPRDSYDAPVDK